MYGNILTTQFWNGPRSGCTVSLHVVDNLVVTFRVRQLGYVVLYVDRLKENSVLLLKPLKVLHPWHVPMPCTVEVVLPSSRIP
jgi:hypothetical protein